MLAVIWTTLRLATVTTVLLILVSTPIAWGLARRRSWWKDVLGAILSLPIVLPPTVLGFYLLLALAPQSPLMAPASSLRYPVPGFHLHRPSHRLHGLFPTLRHHPDPQRI